MQIIAHDPPSVFRENLEIIPICKIDIRNPDRPHFWLNYRRPYTYQILCGANTLISTLIRTSSGRILRMSGDEGGSNEDVPILDMINMRPVFNAAIASAMPTMLSLKYPSTTTIDASSSQHSSYCCIVLRRQTGTVVYQVPGIQQYWRTLWTSTRSTGIMVEPSAPGSVGTYCLKTGTCCCNPNPVPGRGLVGTRACCRQ